MQRKTLIRLVLVVLLALPVSVMLFPGMAAAQGATITVEGDCTLIDAILAANTDAEVGACPAGSGDDIIMLTGDVTLDAVDNDTSGNNGLPSVISHITLEGGGFTIARQAGDAMFRLFHVGEEGTLVLKHVTLSGGETDVILSEGETEAKANGGAIRNEGILFVIESTITGNTANGGGGLSNNGEATIHNSTITGNIAENGGGLYNFGGTMTVVNSTITNNTGGGISNAGALVGVGDLTVVGCTITGNTSKNGGGGLSNVGIGAISNSTIFENTTESGGGGVFNSGTLALTNVTISGNTAKEVGGGIFNSSELTVNHATIVGNQANLSSGLDNYAGQVEINNSIVANGENGGCFGDQTLQLDERGFTGRRNRDSDETCPDTKLIEGLDETLADNGGSTPTHALMENSNAIDNGRDEYCTPTDQRNALRTGERCDIGAFEFGGEPALDGDGDLFIDEIDICPETPNADQFDTDEDGLGDGCDQCPFEAGPVNGCPDGDEDGVMDAEDNCPEAANPEQGDFNEDGTGDACQDSDEDGVMDADDLCPEEPGPVGGCPDADEDGVADAEDQCPDEPGVASEAGCPGVGGSATVESNVGVYGEAGGGGGLMTVLEPGGEFTLLLVGRNEAGDWLLASVDLGGGAVFDGWVEAAEIVTDVDIESLPVVE
jgi:hypothetical protein